MIAVLGADGQLGTAFVSLLGGDALPVTRSQLDLGNADAVRRWAASVDAHSVINCAAFTAVDAAEEAEAEAWAVNSVAVGELASAAAQRGQRFVTFSTDYVFDGTKQGAYVESDETAPINAYGRSKLAGERAALAAHKGALVVRTSWVLSGTHVNFAAKMLQSFGSGELRVVDDQVGCPTLVDDLAPATMEALRSGTGGLLHLANGGAVSWYELALEIAEMAGYGAEAVRPCSTDEFPTPARRPANSVLASERLDEFEIDALPDHRPGLERIVRKLTG